MNSHSPFRQNLRFELLIYLKISASWFLNGLFLSLKVHFLPKMQQFNIFVGVWSPKLICSFYTKRQ